MVIDRPRKGVPRIKTPLQVVIVFKRDVVVPVEEYF
jgi:hypothetical protein